MPWNTPMRVGEVIPYFQSIANLQHIPLLLGYVAARIYLITAGSRKPVVQIVIAATLGRGLKILFCYLADGSPVVLLYAIVFSIGSPGTRQKQASYSKRDQSPENAGNGNLQFSPTYRPT